MNDVFFLMVALLGAYLLFRFRRRKKHQWIYGTVGAEGERKRARKNANTGEVQFVMWKSGEQGYSEDFWINFNSYWWPSFIEDECQAQKESK